MTTISKAIDLHNAIMQNDLTSVKQLVNGGCDVNAADDNGVSPLYWAVWKGDSAITEYIAANGAEINATNRWGSTPLHWAADLGHDLIIKKLIDDGAHVNAKDRSGNMPLHWAARNGFTAAVKCLVNEGAYIEVDNIYGITPIDMALNSGHIEIMEILNTANNMRYKQPNPERQAVLRNLLSEDKQLRSRLGMRDDFNPRMDFNLEHLLSFALSRRRVADPDLEASIEERIAFHIEGGSILTT